MALIKSISGIRGTIGGLAGDNLTPVDLLALLSAFARERREKFSDIASPKIVLGRDGRISGPILHDFASSILRFNGITVLDTGLATTPTVEMAVLQNKAQGGLILSASHNPREWNALKLLDEKGEFLSAEEGKEILRLAEQGNFDYSRVDELGRVERIDNALEKHVEAIMALKLVDRTAVAKRNFKVIVDGINSVGALAIPAILKALGVEAIEVLNEEVNGEFAHNPEPLAEHLAGIKEKVKESGADLGIVVDPDVDRLAFIDEKGNMFGEEYTLVAIADYVLSNYCPCFFQKISVSNLSSSRALKDVTEKHGGSYFAAAVGEVNVVAKMKETGAVIGGEGNGGVIFPELHYGRDALVGTALFLSALAQSDMTVSEYRQKFPNYNMIKDRIELAPGFNLAALLQKVKDNYAGEKITDIDGVKIDWPDSWVHLRASNTEPIIRIYAEAGDRETAQARVTAIKRVIN